jgi:hypothetical protein
MASRSSPTRLSKLDRSELNCRADQQWSASDRVTLDLMPSQKSLPFNARQVAAPADVDDVVDSIIIEPHSRVRLEAGAFSSAQPEVYYNVGHSPSFPHLHVHSERIELAATLVYEVNEG